MGACSPSTLATNRHPFVLGSSTKTIGKSDSPTPMRPSQPTQDTSQPVLALHAATALSNRGIANDSAPRRVPERARISSS